MVNDSSETSNCSHCGEAIEWRSDFDRPYPANKHGSLHRCAATKSKVNEMLGATEADAPDIQNHNAPL